MISARSENELFASYLRNHCGLPTLYGNGDVAAARLCRRDDHVRWVTPDVRAPFRSWSLACLGPSTNKAKQKMSALAPADAFRAQGQVVTPFSSAIKRSAGAAAERAPRRGAAHASRCPVGADVCRAPRLSSYLSSSTDSVFFSPCFASTRAAAFARPRVRAREIPAGAVRSACPCSAKRRLRIVAHGERRVRPEAQVRFLSVQPTRG